MIYIDVEHLQDGLYNVKNGEIYKYKAKGGTVRVYKLERRPRGEWEIYTVSPFDGEDCRCSNCGKTGCAPYWNYCPNCGSRNKLKGADDETD